MVTQVQTVETREDALRRLAQVARESGVKLLRDNHGEYWATSVSEPGWLYPVTPESCGCRGHATHRRCRHIAATGFSLVTVTSDTGSCPVCTGPGKWAYGSIVCGTCHGTGTTVAA